MAPHLRAHVPRIDSAAPGVLEFGAPNFSVISKESIGLRSQPTDLRLLEDGRVLVVADRQLAFGDGIRWTVYEAALSETSARGRKVAIEDGEIYQAVEGGFGRVVFGEDGYWRLEQVADWLGVKGFDHPIPLYCETAGENWFWHNRSGSLLGWRLGEGVESYGGVYDSIAEVFTLGENIYVSDASRKELIEITRGPQGEVKDETAVWRSVFVTSSLSLESGEFLLGTNKAGLFRFDGEKMAPFEEVGRIAEKYRISGLARISEDYIAAAMEGYGVVFFDLEGKRIQSLGATLDHRLSRVSAIGGASFGTVWGIVPEGIFRVEMPSRFTRFEPLIGRGFTASQLYRHNGDLLISADDIILRGQYDDEKRLTGFKTESLPAGALRGIWAKHETLAYGMENGGYIWRGKKWERFAAGKSFPMIIEETRKGEWLFRSENEIGWLRDVGGVLETTMYPVEGFGHFYSGRSVGPDEVWLELGTG
ncbi:hypothetical protein [Pelagicoccus mobilis]|uniref:WG repeat-containing protein n=1 Tax=Pelagicoccus mobilis TaxID=415221 RepID=A0A934RTL8_9BACT|nr:hypothetical protein [Pelagicoccus mobilis]MBK1876146.1 hypothetical protein [Pelagicoccus mobilis]